MKHTDPGSCLSCDLLGFIRDSNPTESELLEWLDTDSNVGRFHLLRKAGLIELVEGHVVLSPAHLSSDGSAFMYRDRVFKIDENMTLHVCRRPDANSDGAG